MRGPDNDEIEVDEITSEEAANNLDRQELPNKDEEIPNNDASPTTQEMGPRIDQDVHTQLQLNPIQMASRNEGAALADQDLPASILSNDMLNSRVSR